MKSAETRIFKELLAYCDQALQQPFFIDVKGLCNSIITVLQEVMESCVQKVTVQYL